jgi:hypothetical protein
MLMVMRDNRVVFAQVPLLKSQLEELKQRSGTSTTKDALQAAVDHYLACPATAEPAGPGSGQKREGDEKDWWWSPSRKERAEGTRTE